MAQRVRALTSFAGAYPETKMPFDYEKGQVFNLPEGQEQWLKIGYVEEFTGGPDVAIVEKNVIRGLAGLFGRNAPAGAESAGDALPEAPAPAPVDAGAVAKQMLSALSPDQLAGLLVAACGGDQDGAMSAIVGALEKPAVVADTGGETKPSGVLQGAIRKLQGKG